MPVHGGGSASGPDAHRPSVSTCTCVPDLDPGRLDAVLLLYVQRPVVERGVLGLLRKGTVARVQVCADARSALQALEQRAFAAIVDAAAGEADTVIAKARSASVPVALLVDSPRDRRQRRLARLADAVLRLADADADGLALALGAAGRGLTLRPGRAHLDALTEPDFDHAGEEGERSRALEALSLVAGGLRDAEIAERLHLSESAARKLVQRAVHQLGGRTRCHAVARAVDRGYLD